VVKGQNCEKLAEGSAARPEGPKPEAESSDGMLGRRGWLSGSCV